MKHGWNAMVTAAGLLCGCGGSPNPAADGSGADGSGGITAVGTDGANADGDGTDSADDSDGADEPTPIQFDVGVPDVELDCDAGGPGGGGSNFSYIWVANSPEGTVSKINTQTLVEEGRYLVRDTEGGSPSRTSVNLNGDVAVANRTGGVTKVIARTEDCPDPGNTSTGADDVKPWQDGCIAWSTPFVYDSQRPVAWTQGTKNPDTCRYENAKVWTSGATGDAIEVVLMDGETGEVEEIVPIPGVAASYYGIYGGAVDADGNFWGTQLSFGHVVKVNLADMSVETWPMQGLGYGMTVDPQGRVWTCASAVNRFSPDTETWDSNGTVGFQGGGCMVDAEGLLWVGGYDNSNGNYSSLLMGVDTETLEIQQSIPIPGYAKGISIDFQGYVWAVSTAADAYRVDPMTGNFDTFSGLSSPYTYSDMTGFALSNAGSPAG